MSAYQVHPDTIDLLVTAAAAWRLSFDNREGTDSASLCATTHRDQAGQLLTNENARSVNYRYNETYDSPSYNYQFVDLDRAAVAMPVAVLVLASVRCLRYQSCDTPNYAETCAARFLDRIESEACRRLIDTYDAPWGFTRDWMETKRAEAKARIAEQIKAVR
jgi:hypothetical protein